MNTNEPGAGHKKVLNVGGNNKKIAIPATYAGWTHHLLDIDPTGGPDIVCDARELVTLPSGGYDGIYCSHNLEHYFAHDVPKVLSGFLHVLTEDGFAEIRVPDLDQLMRRVVEQNLDLLDVLYQSPAGPVHVRDVIYGYAPQIARSGHDFYAHKTGFTPKSLTAALQTARFAAIALQRRDLEIRAIAFKSKPGPHLLQSLGFTPPAS